MKKEESAPQLTNRRRSIQTTSNFLPSLLGCATNEERQCGLCGTRRLPLPRHPPRLWPLGGRRRHPGRHPRTPRAPRCPLALRWAFSCADVITGLLSSPLCLQGFDHSAQPKHRHAYWIYPPPPIASAPIATADVVPQEGTAVEVVTSQGAPAVVPPVAETGAGDVKSFVDGVLAIAKPTPDASASSARMLSSFRRNRLHGLTTRLPSLSLQPG